MGSRQQSKSKDSNYIVLLFAFFFAIVVIIAILLNENLQPYSKGTESLLNITNINSIFNIVGYKYFDVYGYLIVGNVSYSKFPNYASGKIYGFNSIDVVGDVSLGESITAFIFNNYELPNSEFNNNSMLESFYDYENPVTNISVTTINYNKSIILKKFAITTDLANGTIKYKTYGISFVYKNSLFMCSSSNESFCLSPSEYLIKLFNEGQKS